jgi:hypothetical protein
MACRNGPKPPALTIAPLERQAIYVSGKVVSPDADASGLGPETALCNVPNVRMDIGDAEVHFHLLQAKRRSGVCRPPR